MKIKRFPAAVLVTATFLLAISASSAVAQNSTSAFGPVPPPSQPLVDAIQLSGGIQDVLKLSRAKVNEEVIIAFIQNGNRHFNLSASEILYLRKEGVTDRVLTAMLGQPAPAATPELLPSYEASAPQYISEPMLVEAVPASTVYVGAPAYYSFYDPWPYWSCWYPYPAFSFGFYWGWSWGGCGYWSYPGYCYPNYCYNGSWNNYCNGYYSSTATTRPTADTALVSEMRQPSGVSRARPLVSEMRQPSGVNQSTGTQPVGSSGVSQTASRNESTRGGNRSASPTAARTTSYWSGNGSRPTPSRSGEFQTATPTRTPGTATSRTPASRPTESRGGTQFTVSRNAGPSASQRPAAPTYINRSAGSIYSSSSPATRGTTWSRPANLSGSRSVSSPAAVNSQRSFSPTYRSSGNIGSVSRPSMSPSFSSRGSASRGFSAGGSRGVASGSGRGGAMSAGGGRGR